MARSRSRSPRSSPRRSRSRRKSPQRSRSRRKSPRHSRSPRRSSRRSPSVRRSSRKSPPSRQRSKSRSGRRPSPRRQRSRSRKDVVKVEDAERVQTYAVDSRGGRQIKAVHPAERMIAVDAKKVEAAASLAADAESKRFVTPLNHRLETKGHDARRLEVMKQRAGVTVDETGSYREVVNLEAGSSGVVNLEAGSSDADMVAKAQEMLKKLKQEKKLKKEKKAEKQTGTGGAEKKEKKGAKKAKKAKKELKKAKKLLKSIKKGKKGKKAKKSSSSSDSSSESSSSEDPFEFVMGEDFADGPKADAHHAEARIANWLGITSRMAKMDHLQFVSRDDDEEMAEQAKFEEQIANGKRDENGKLKENRDNDWICMEIPSIDGKVCEGRNFPKNDFCYSCKAKKPRDPQLVRNVNKLTCGDKAADHGRGSYNGKVCGKFMGDRARGNIKNAKA